MPRVLMDTFSSLANIYELRHFLLPHLLSEEPIYKSRLKNLPSHWATPQLPIIPPLLILSLNHILDLVCGQLGLLTCRHPHNIQYLVELNNEFLGVSSTLYQ